MVNTYNSNFDVDTAKSRAALEGFIRLLNKGDVSGAFERYTTDDYTQHMAGVAPGRAGAVAYVEDELKRGGTVAVLGFVAQGKMAGLHIRQTFADGSECEVIELWRVENGRLAEHWGASQPANTTS